MLASLTQEVSLLTDILQLKLQKAEMATRGLQTAPASNADNGHSHVEPAPKAKKSTKTKSEVKK